MKPKFKDRFIETFPLLSVMQNNGDVPDNQIRIAHLGITLDTEEYRVFIEVNPRDVNNSRVRDDAETILIQRVQWEMLRRWSHPVPLNRSFPPKVTDDMRQNALLVIPPKVHYDYMRLDQFIYNREPIGERFYYDGMRVMVDQIDYLTLFRMREMLFWNLRVSSRVVEELENGEKTDFDLTRDINLSSRFFVELTVSGIFFVPVYVPV